VRPASPARRAGPGHSPCSLSPIRSQTRSPILSLTRNPIHNRTHNLIPSQTPSPIHNLILSRILSRILSPTLILSRHPVRASPVLQAHRADEPPLKARIMTKAGKLSRPF